MKSLLTLSLAILFALIVTVTPRFTVISPDPLADQFPNDINFTTGHYGVVPYGAHMVGNLTVVEPADGCSQMKSFTKGEKSTEGNVIGLVQRGGCRVTAKIRNAQAAGAKALVIINSEDSDWPEWFGNEHGFDDIKIPTIMIKKSDGEKLYKHFLDRQDRNVPLDEDRPLVSIRFPYEWRTNTVELELWYSSADVYGSAYLFLKRFQYFYQNNKDKVFLIPHFVTWTCSSCKKTNFQTESPNCLSGGRYCSPDPDREGSITGADVVYEDLRQICIFEASPDLWWTYAGNFADECLNSDNLEKCSAEVLGKLATSNQDTIINNCTAESFFGPTNRPINKRLDENLFLKEEKRLQNEYSINQFPALFINNKPYYGKLEHAGMIIQEVCKNLKDPSPDCLAALGKATFTSNVHHQKTNIFVMFVIMTIVACLVFYCCRRLMKREGKNMSVQINGLVTQYFALKEGDAE